MFLDIVAKTDIISKINGNLAVTQVQFMKYNENKNFINYLRNISNKKEFYFWYFWNAVNQLYSLS